MRPTNLFEKALNSLINVAVAFVLFSPLLLVLNVSLLSKKLIFILLFFVYQIAIILFNKNISLGMIVTHSRWKYEYSLPNQFIHTVLYTISFSTLLFWVYFPFDLFLANMLLVQVPSILLTGSTFHGYLAGKMITIKSTKMPL